jgi:hypothetical protein
MAATEGRALLKIMTQATGARPRPWGGSIVGFDRLAPILARLGRHKNRKGCLHIESLQEVRLPALEQLIRRSVAHQRGGG